MSGNLWVVKYGDGWAVKFENTEPLLYTSKTQSDAIRWGTIYAKAYKCELLIQGEDGKIRSKDSYGNDPHPPIDTEH